MNTAAANHRIRVMTAGDLDEVTRIERESFDAPWGRSQFLAPVGGGATALDLVLETGKGGGRRRIVGYASAWVIAGEMQINNLAVAPECRNQGHGARILEHLLKAAAALHCSEVSLEVSRANDHAVRLYEAGGFRKVGVRKGYYRDSGEDALILTRLIGIVF